MSEDKESHATFGALLRRHRKALECTVTELANHLGVSMTYLSDVERDRRPPLSAQRINKIARYFSLSNDEWDALLMAHAREWGAFCLSVEGAGERKMRLGMALVVAWKYLTDEQLDAIAKVLEETK
ncbi:MAG TPA: helix-turn-helix transcriptional regulator [Vicinamibacterales bacterium]